VTRTLLALLTALILGAGTACADGYADSAYRLPTLVAIGWESIVPQRALRGTLDRTSFRGGQLEIGYGVARHLSLGFSGSWSWMAQSFAAGSLPLPDGEITGKAYRRVQLVELRATAHRYLTNGPVQPYLGVGAGGGWHGSYVAVADVIRTAGAWHAAGEPRAGLLLTLRPGLAVNLQARYVFSTARIGDARDARWLAVDLGVALY
jgi:hypothetical protein